MGILSALAAISERLPAVEKPKRRPTLYQRLMWTGIVLVIYFVMSNIPLYGIPPQGESQIGIMQILFASNVGTLTELGIGPIVTAGLILQVLAGAKLIDLDLTDPEDRRVFTGAQTTLAILFGVFEAAMYVMGCRYWQFTGSPITGCSATGLQRAVVVVQLVIATYIIILLDQMLQRGWGLGSAISLFILAGVANQMFWRLFGISTVGGAHPGLLPYLFQVRNPRFILLRRGAADLVGLVATLAVIILLVYLQGMKVEIPVTTQRLRGIRSRVPLQFIYVTNIPILLVGILVADLALFANLAGYVTGPDSLPAKMLNTLATYMQPPQGGFYAVLYELSAGRLLAYIASWFVLSVLFGFMWVEIAGLSPSAQAEQLMSSGLDIPGIRRNPKMLEKLLSKYIYPLTLLSSLIVAGIAVLADLFGAYGTGSGILLAVGIIYQYYTMIAYERALEAYPLLRRLLGE